jgi:DNA polymerase-4
VFAVATELLDGNLPPGTAVRLLGVRVELLVRGAVAEQLTLDGDSVSAYWSDVERAADAARSRFGGAAVRLATLLERPGISGGGAEQSPESGNQIG